MFTDVKSHFNLGSTIFFNCAYMGPLSSQTQRAGIAAIKMKSMPVVYEAKHYFQYSDDVRQAFNTLINGEEQKRVAILPSVSYGMAIVANNTIAKSQGNVVIVENEMPSNYFIWERYCRDHNLEMRISKPYKHQSVDITQAIINEIDDNTIVVTTGAVHWQDGSLIDIKKVCECAHAHGALFVFDGTQSLGVMPYKQSDIKADAVIAAGYKWMLGPYSLAVGYFSSYFDDGIPLEEPWLNREHSEDFKNLTDYSQSYRPYAVRFDMGESSNFILCPMLANSINELITWGIEDIYQHVSDINQYIEKKVVEFVPTLINSASQRGRHFLTLVIDDEDQRSLLPNLLKERGISVSVRGNNLRISTHIYNDMQDADMLLDALLSVVS